MDRPGPWKKLADDVDSRTEAAAKPLPTVSSLVCPSVPFEKRPVGPLSIGANGGMPDVPPANGLSPDWPANGVFQDGTGAGPQWKLTEIAERDGTETTILLAENVDAGPWTSIEEPRLTVLWFPSGLSDIQSPLLALNESPGRGDGSVRFARPGALHKGGWVTAYCDESVKWTHGQIDPVAWSQLMSVDGTKTCLPGQEVFLPAPYRRESTANLPTETLPEDSDEPKVPENP